jgi:adenylate cyclase
MQATEIDAVTVRKQLAKILASASFARNERLAGLLRFVVEQYLAGHANQLKASIIGVEFFGKPDYDPRQDSLVRTEAAKVRARLREYYAGEGAGDSAVIELPKGGYAPIVRFVNIGVQTEVKRRWRIAGIAVGALVLVGLGVFWTGRAVPEQKTIAVLPFENQSSEAETEYFSDGLADEVIQSLSGVEGLEVRSRTSSFTLKGKSRNIREVGGLLNVNYVVEGSVARSADKLRVHVQLVRTKRDIPLWSGQFDRELKDVFAIQDEISRAIVNELRLKLAPGQRRYNTSVEAYDLYLKARQLVDRGGPDQLYKGIDLFEQVLAKDGGYTPAYAGLAKAYTAISSRAVITMPPTESDRKIRFFADKALEADPLLAEAWVFRGVALSHDYRWTDAEKAFRRAMELNPNLAEAHLYYGYEVLFKIGRQEEAFRETRRAIELDPVAPEPLGYLVYLLETAGRVAEAWEADLRLQTMNPAPTAIHASLLIQKGRIEEAIPYLSKGEGGKGYLGYAYGRLGKRAEAEQLLVSQQMFPHHIALICAGLADKDCVIESLNRMADIKDSRVHFYLVYPELAIIRGDPRVEALRKKIGL